MKLNFQDLRWAVLRLPSNLRKIMQDPEWSDSIFVGGGYLRSIIANEKINDVDVFVKSVEKADALANLLAADKHDIIKTQNAYTIRGKLTIQIIHRWVFNKPEDVSNSFDFTIACAIIYCTSTKRDSEKGFSDVSFKWDSFCDNLFYIDLAAKRLTYRSPVRNEDAGGSMLRVLKYYQKGYRIPLDSLGAVIARLVKEINPSKIDIKDEFAVSCIITGLLREVDPSVDPTHNAHLPSATDDGMFSETN